MSPPHSIILQLVETVRFFLYILTKKLLDSWKDVKYFIFQKSQQDCEPYFWGYYFFPRKKWRKISQSSISRKLSSVLSHFRHLDSSTSRKHTRQSLSTFPSVEIHILLSVETLHGYPIYGYSQTFLIVFSTSRSLDSSTSRKHMRQNFSISRNPYSSTSRNSLFFY